VAPASPAKKPDLLTSEEVMDRLLAEGNLRTLALRCVLPAVRIGDEWRFRSADLDDWIAQHRLPARSTDDTESVRN
jgi:hypothetical protein